MNIKDQIKNVAYDLLNLEVNTIVKSNITGRKMPNPQHALIDIAKTYLTRMTAYGCHVDLKNAEKVKDDKIGEYLESGGYHTFEAIRNRAKTEIKALEEKAKNGGLDAEEEAKLLMLWRIKGMSDQIKGIYNNLNKRKEEKYEMDFDRNDIEDGKIIFQFTADELVKIRKIWEMGVQEIALQTVIQMDGDVITCVKRGYDGPGKKDLYDLHNMSIGTSIGIWKELIGIVKDFLGSLLKLIMR